MGSGEWGVGSGEGWGGWGRWGKQSYQKHLEAEKLWFMVAVACIK